MCCCCGNNKVQFSSVIFNKQVQRKCIRVKSAVGSRLQTLSYSDMNVSQHYVHVEEESINHLSSYCPALTLCHTLTFEPEHEIGLEFYKLLCLGFRNSLFLITIEFKVTFICFLKIVERQERNHKSP